jgi:hypothetical protein
MLKTNIDIILSGDHFMLGRIVVHCIMRKI